MVQTDGCYIVHWMQGTVEILKSEKSEGIRIRGREGTCG
jgi:hypothetical protein